MNDLFVNSEALNQLSISHRAASFLLDLDILMINLVFPVILLGDF